MEYTKVQDLVPCKVWHESGYPVKYCARQESLLISFHIIQITKPL